MKTKVFIFDLDDTLYCEHDYVHSGLKAVAHYLAVDDVQKENTYYEYMVQVWKKVGRGKIFDLTCDYFGLKEDISDLVHVYREHQPKLQLYPDAIYLLNLLKEKSTKMGLITDGHKGVQWKKIDALNLINWIAPKFMMVTDDLGREFWKPSDVPYNKIAEQLGVEPQNCVYIGDNPHKDFVTARKLGYKTIRVIREIGDHMAVKLDKAYEADRVIRSLEMIMDL
jgi:putative hydrolase of the HAD superfamily